jgi:hypothetical protein
MFVVILLHCLSNKASHCNLTLIVFNYFDINYKLLKNNEVIIVSLLGLNAFI